MGDKTTIRFFGLIDLILTKLTVIPRKYAVFVKKIDVTVWKRKMKEQLKIRLGLFICSPN